MKKMNVKLLLLATVFVGCSKSKQPSDTNGNKEIMLKQHATLGNILTDKNGRTLYYFAKDVKGQSSCTGECEEIWPAFNVKDLTQKQLGSGLLIADFGSITTSSGKKQLTYKGWPLYSFTPIDKGTPEAPGATGGEGINSVWFVAKPDYSVMLAMAQLIGADGKNYRSDYTEGTGETLYFTDETGAALYSFSVDRQNKNKFTLPDFSNNPVWPIFETDKVVVPSILDKTLFGSITVHGKKQLTYKGWPLYFFGADNKVRGSNKGVSQPTPGVWPIAVQNLPLATPET